MPETPIAESATASAEVERSVMGHVLAIGQDDFDAAHGIDTEWLRGDRQPHDFVPPLAEKDHCALSRRVDGKKHSWRFDGDDPYIICAFCDEVRDAISGLVIRNGRTDG